MGQYVCPHCNHRLLELTAFCIHCGKQLPADLKSDEYTCPNCGEVVGQELLFLPNYCGVCGLEVNPSAG